MDESDENDNETPAMSPSSSSVSLDDLGECCIPSRARKDAVDRGVESSREKNNESIQGILSAEKDDGGSRRADEIGGIAGTTGRRIGDVHYKEHPVSPGGGGNGCWGDRPLGKTPLHHHGDDQGKHIRGVLNDGDDCDGERHHEKEQGDQDEPSMLAQSKS